MSNIENLAQQCASSLDSQNISDPEQLMHGMQNLLMNSNVMEHLSK